MKITQKGINLIKQFEGVRLTAYQDSVGVWTIGYGHTGSVSKGQTITQIQAEELLKTDCEKFEVKVSNYNNTYSWTQNEFDALVSFAFNVGSINQLTDNGKRTKAEIASKILQYNKAGGKVLAGLTSRRQKERELFLTPDENQTKNEPVGWVKSSSGKWWYRREDGTYPANKWCIINHHYYLFNADGIMVTGWNRWDGKTCNPVDGSGGWYYLDNTINGDFEGACWHEKDIKDGSLEIWYINKENDI